MRPSRWLFVSVLAAAAAPAVAQTPERVRGTIVSLAGDTLDVKPQVGPDRTVALAPETRVTLCDPTTLDAIKPGSFIGTAAKPGVDGHLEAVEVHVFPESMRGAGEGHRPFDLGPTSTMTNGTVGQEVLASGGRTLTVRYKGGEKAVDVPPGTPIVTFEPGGRERLVPGAHVIAFLRAGTAGTTVAASVVVGKDGLVPPM